MTQQTIEKNRHYLGRTLRKVFDNEIYCAYGSIPVKCGFVAKGNAYVGIQFIAYDADNPEK